MASPRVIIVRAPGTNCDQETAFAFQTCGGTCEIVHINRLLVDQRLLDNSQIICIPGGFSYGDDIAAGRIFANQLCLGLSDAVRRFRDQGKLILGICNGFQALLKSGLLTEQAGNLPGASQESTTTLTWNNSQKYEDRWVQLEADGSKCVFLRGIESMYLPIAHAEGKFVASEPSVLDQLADRGQLALRYSALSYSKHSAGEAHSESGLLAYPDNPNGSDRNVAGICDPSGRVFGLMPHPERFIDAIQHPRWTREPAREHGDGKIVFQNAIEYFAA